MTEDINADSMTVIFQIIVPGDGQSWPNAGVVLRHPELILNKFAISDLSILDAMARHVAQLAVAERIPAVKAFEAEKPVLFRQLVAAVMDAYYTTPEVLAQIEALANAAPREPSLQFDQALVANVVRTQAGTYRA